MLDDLVADLSLNFDNLELDDDSFESWLSAKREEIDKLVNAE